MEKEIEEASELVYPPNYNSQGEDSEYYERIAFKTGAKYIAKKMYSETEVEQLLHLAVFQSQCTSNRITRPNSNTCADFVNKWFRINKKEIVWR
jgi:hypothetical protein